MSDPSTPSGSRRLQRLLGRAARATASLALAQDPGEIAIYPLGLLGGFLLSLIRSQCDVLDLRPSCSVW